MSTSTGGLARRSFINGSKLWPPASTLASSLVRRRSMASSTDPGAAYLKDAGITQHTPHRAMVRTILGAAQTRTLQQDSAPRLPNRVHCYQNRDVRPMLAYARFCSAGYPIHAGGRVGLWRRGVCSDHGHGLQCHGRWPEQPNTTRALVLRVRARDS